jgi:hypothetical protein
MPVLDFILPAANRAVSSDSGIPPSFATNTAGGESFDHVMTRALSPAETDGAAGADPSAAVPTVAGGAQQNIIFTPGQRHFVSTGSIVSAKTATVAGETGDSATPLADPSGAPSTDRAAKISTKDHTAVATAAPAAANQNIPPAAADGLPGVIMGLVAAALPASVTPTPSSVTDKSGTADATARSTASSSSQTTTAAGADISEIPTARRQTKTGDSVAGTRVNPESSSNPKDEAFVSTPTPAGQQKNAVKAGNPTAGETVANAATTAALSVSDLKKQSLPASPGDGAELKSTVEPVACFSFAGTASATNTSAARVMPATAEASDTAAMKNKSSDLPATVGMVTDLTTADFSIAEFSAVNESGLTSAAQPASNLSNRKLFRQQMPMRLRCCPQPRKPAPRLR